MKSCYIPYYSRFSKANNILCNVFIVAGFHVYLPDFFQGDELHEEDLSFMELPSKTLCSKVGKVCKLFRAIPKVIKALRRHGDAVTKPQISSCLMELKEKAKQEGNGKIGCCGTILFTVEATLTFYIDNR